MELGLTELFQVKYFHLFLFLPVEIFAILLETNHKNLLPLTLWPFNNKKSKKVTKKVQEDAKLMTNELIRKYKYPSENHNVTTEDGYILTLHRIPKPGLQPILLMHGFLESSASFILMGPKNSLAYRLSDQDYDVWLGNSRGNRYSKRHITLKPNNKEFWNFSWHEIGYYDLPATIDYIRNATSFHAIFYVGHSQGATAFFVMSSLRSEYNEKIILMQAFAPLVFMGNTRTEITKIERFIMSKNKSIGELMPYGWMNHLNCERNSFYKYLCKDNIYSIVGKDSNQFNEDLWPLIFNHLPAGGSIKQARHFLQLTKSKQFAHYDYGETENLKRYNQSAPPIYNLSQVEAPVIIYFADNDLIAALKDVHILYQILPQVKGLYAAGNKDFNHMDFIWSKDLKTKFLDKFFKILNDFNNNVLKYVIE